MTEKRPIVEMARTLCQVYDREHDRCKLDLDFGRCDLDCYHYRYAKQVYNEGYHKQEWISVEERLPENLQEVLAYRGNHIGNLMNVYTYVGGDMWQDEYGFGCRQADEGITHWMPLPKPPKMKGE